MKQRSQNNGSCSSNLYIICDDSYNRDDLIQTLGSGILTKNSQNQINGKKP